MANARPLICGFIKVRNEIYREGNIHRAITNMQKFCDTIVACDDASFDGTREYLQKVIPKEQLLLIPPEQQDFRQELFWKQQMLDIVHTLRPEWVWWHDADEELDEKGVEEIRAFCESQRDSATLAYRFHYIQLWRQKEWHRIDDGFADGKFIKLWRWQPYLSFNVRHGTHHDQFPEQISSHLNKIEVAPWKVIHWGNYGVNLRWKCIQYWGGLGGVERHLSFEGGRFRAWPEKKAEPQLSWSTDPTSPRPKAVSQVINANGYVVEELSDRANYFSDREKVPVDSSNPIPWPYDDRDKKVIRSLQNMKKLPATFAIVIPTHNRGWALDQTMQSLVNQTYQKWIAFVLDDGSTDNTEAIMKRWQDNDQRIFYGKYNKIGAVAINEIGMNTAIETAEWWTRLGSDDYFEPHKLELDAMALARHDWIYGPYRVLRDNKLAEMCNKAMPPETAKQALLAGNFVVSWANMACRCDLLKKVKDAFGAFCDKRLLNMEDFLFNTRLARFSEPIYRAKYGTMTVIDQRDPMMLHPHEADHDAIWRVSTDGASSNVAQTANEDGLTRQIIAEDTEKWSSIIMQ
jgi:hypothetical protein